MDNATVILLTLSSAILSGMGVGIMGSYTEGKKEKARQAEREQDQLKIELKDLQIKLYKLEKDLIEWKDRYYSTIQELISVRAELEETMVKLSLIHSNYED
jgi:hypothetical protein